MSLRQSLVILILMLSLVGCGDYVYNHGAMLPGGSNPGYNVSY